MKGRTIIEPKNTWDESLETGNAHIDGQHRQVIKLNDEVKAAESKSRAEVMLALDKIMEFTLVHFISEEELMSEVSYPPQPTKTMIDQHKEFKSYLRLRILEFRRSGEPHSVLPLQSFMDHFLKVHEFGTDRLLADWIRRTHKTP